MSMELINNIQADMLGHLGRFGFLSVSQFQVLTGKSVGYIREMLGSIKRRGYISSYRIELSYQVRAENIYFLMPLGREFLTSHKAVFGDAIKMPISKSPVVTKDYWHRYNFITVQIYLYKFFSERHISIGMFHAYFDKSGSIKAGNLTAKTTITIDNSMTLIPDGVMIAGGKLYLLEMYMDKSSQRAISQLATHAKAITTGAPAKTFAINDNPQILSVFDKAGVKQALIKKLKEMEGFAAVSHLYFFASLDEVRNNIQTAFKTIDGNNLLLTT